MHGDTNSWKLNLIENYCGEHGWGMGVIIPITGLWEWLYIKDDNEITEFLHADTNSENPKLALVIFGWLWSIMGMV